MPFNITYCPFQGLHMQICIELFFSELQEQFWLDTCTDVISNSYYKNRNWLQILFFVKDTALKQQTSKFYPQSQCTEASHHIYFSQRPVINVKATYCASNLQIKLWYLLL